LGRIPDRVIEEIRERADVVQVISRHVTLKKSGSRYLGLCPFHTEKTPSFNVNPDRQIFHCFGCGEGGDVFAFRMHQDGSDFLDAVRSLAAEFGVEIPSDAAEQSRSAPLYGANERALAYFRQALRSPGGAPARGYLERRGVPADLIDRFQLGYAPPGWDGLIEALRKERTPLEHAEEAGLIVPRQTGNGHYDRFRGRLIFPIIEATGRVVGFGGRGLADETPKYLNSSESPIYRKGRALFGLSLAVDAIRSKGRAIVVEGYFDLMALHRAGLEEGVAPCGTALTQEHARRLRRYTRDVVLLFDGDTAGQRAAERSLPVMAAEGLRVQAAFLPEGEDPDTLLAKQGVDALVECVDGALPLIDHLIDQRLGMKPLREWEAADIARSFGPLLAAVPDVIERGGYERRIAGRLQLEPAVIVSALREGPQRPQAPSAEPGPPRSAAAIEPLVRTLIGALAAFPELAPPAEALPAAALPEGESGQLLRIVLEALRGRGSQAIAHLTSHAAGELPDELRLALSGAIAESDPGTESEARRAADDCLSQLRIRALDRESRQLNGRLESCSDRAELDGLLERKQQNMRERDELWRRVHQV
jgi:DNA primase